MKKKQFSRRNLAVVLIAGLLAVGTVRANTYYSIPGTNFASRGADWNTEPDQSGSAGVSATYRSGLNDLVLQAGSVFKMSGSYYSDNPWNAISYLLAGATLWFDGTGSGTFNGGDILVTADSSVMTSGSGFINGNGTLQLGDRTLLFAPSGAPSGTFDFGLNVSGGGELDLGMTPSNLILEFSNLSTQFTGRVLADTFSGIIRFSSGDGTRGADLVLAANESMSGRLDLTGNFSLDSLTIEGVVVPRGLYGYDDLVAIGSAHSKTFSDNLIDHGGTVDLRMLSTIAVDPTVLAADWESGEWTSGNSPSPVLSFQEDGISSVETNMTETRYVVADSSVARTGDWSLKIYAEPPTFRSEIAYINPIYCYSTDSEFYYSFSYLADDGWTTNTSPYSIIIAQWKNFGTPPQAQLRLRNDGSREAFFMSSDYTTQHELGVIPANEWTDFVVYINWTTNSTGKTKIWKNGELILDLTGATQTTNGNGYLKLGMYTEINHPRTIYIDDVRIGTNVFQNWQPTFKNDPFSTTNATANTSYSATLADDAEDIDGDPLSFYKKSGPPWLRVAANGDLSGMPESADIGTNVFVVEVKDDVNGRADATLTIKVNSQYDSWIYNYDVGDAVAYTNDPDGDGLCNLMEYALGGYPDTFNQPSGILPTLEPSFDGGSNDFIYIYRRRRDAEVRGLSYSVRLAINLVAGVWGTNGYFETEVVILDEDFELVVNRIPTEAHSNQFVRLNVYKD